MKFNIALAGSLFLHLVLITALNFHIAPQKIDILKSNVLEVSLKSLKMAEYKEVPIYNVLSKTRKVESYDYQVKSRNSNKENLHINSTESIGVSTEIDIFDSYLPTQLLERKAIPISNIDISMLQNVFISGLPIKLRLYINNQGTVVKIEEVAVMDQDQDFKIRLIELLYKTTFLPAKKNRIDVDSYQDVEFSFKSNLMTE